MKYRICRNRLHQAFQLQSRAKRVTEIPGKAPRRIIEVPYTTCQHSFLAREPPLKWKDLLSLLQPISPFLLNQTILQPLIRGTLHVYLKMTSISDLLGWCSYRLLIKIIIICGWSSWKVDVWCFKPKLQANSQFSSFTPPTEGFSLKILKDKCVWEAATVLLKLIDTQHVITFHLWFDISLQDGPI